jgi:hypothetical protein
VGGDFWIDDGEFESIAPIHRDVGVVLQSESCHGVTL